MLRRFVAITTTLLAVTAGPIGCGDDTTSASGGSTGTDTDDPTADPSTDTTTVDPTMDTDGTTSVDPDTGSSTDDSDTDTSDTGEDPPEPPEGEVVDCRNDIPVAPAGEVCDVTAGSGNATLIRGTVLSGQTIYETGTLLVEDGRISCVGCDCAEEAPADAAVLDCAQGVVSPGLINPHDHITFSLSQPQPHGDERYDHRHEWRLGLGDSTEIDTYPGSNNSTEGVLYGELRMLFGAATSVSGSGSASGLIRNLDRGEDTEGLAGVDVDYATFPLGDSDGTLLSQGCDYPFIENESALNASVYMPHVSEGINDEANNEFACLSGQPGNDLIAGNTAVIHGIGVRPSDIAEMAEVGAKLVWSPRSNIDLYGITADVLAYHHQGVGIALGTDWSASGSMNVMRELACAAYLNDNHLGEAFSDYELWMMSTYWAAASQGAGSQIGLLAEGFIADVAIFDGSENAHYRAIIDGEPSGVQLVMRGGDPLFGDDTIIEGLVSADDLAGCEVLEMCGEDKRVCVQLDTGLSLAQITGAVNPDSYDLFACGQPDLEPSCDPFRPMEFPARDGVTDSDADGIPDADDNCPSIFNPLRPMDAGSQADEDQDGIGDACDLCALDPDNGCEIPDPLDADGDGVGATEDNCPADANPGQEDMDADGVGDVCDVCPNVPNPGNGACPASIYEVKDGTLPEGTAVLLQDKVVTAAAPGFGFFIQTHPDDDDYVDVDYSAAFVYVGGGFTAEAGDRVTISGNVQNFFGQTQVVLSGGVTIESVDNPLPDPEPATVADVVEGGSRQEQLEAALVTIADLDVTDVMPAVGPGDMNPGGEFEVDGGLRVDNLFYTLDPFPTVGQNFPQLSGVLRWANSYSKLEPRGPQDLPVALASFGPDGFIEVGVTDIPIPGLTVQLTTTATADTDIALTYEDTGIVDGPASVTVPMGSDSVDVSLTGVASGTASVTASFGGNDVDAIITAYADADARIPTLTPTELDVTLSTSATLSVELNLPAPAAGQVVNLSAAPGTFATVPATVLVPADALSAQFEVTALDTVGTEVITADIAGATSDATINVVDTPPVGLVIAEVYYNHTGGDDDFEWVKLFNGTGADIDLSTYSLGYGGTDYTYAQLQLVGTIGAGECFLVGGPSGDADSGFAGPPMFDQAVAFSPGMQNSGATADAVALFDVTADMIGAATVPIDAVIYGENNVNGLLDETGAAGAVDVADVGSAASAVLQDDLTWGVSLAPTPTVCLPFPAAG
ncbi:MAG: amidohydrolase family protein [Nannocystaceae bacterium]|nr:thrombospondin type 3 repeat-containing protein [bacterium]